MIPVAEPIIGEKELFYVLDAVKSGWVSSKGSYVKKFEDKFAEYCNAKYAASCNNGTSALHLALLSLGIGEGDEVIAPSLAYIAVANVINYVRAKPVFVDVSKETLGMDPEKIEEKITPQTKAIIVVHLYGMPCEMDRILDIAKKYNLFLIEDCAEAHGAEYKGKKVGTFGDIGCFSFFGNKIITTGEGGMCITNNEELKEKIELLKNQGVSKERKYWHPVIGFNYRMTNIQAAIGLAQLEQIDSFLKIREEHEEIYENLLKEISGIKFLPKRQQVKIVYWMHSIIIENRDKIMKKLEKEGIETRPFFVVINKMPPYLSEESFPVAEEVSDKGINLPSSVNLTEENIKIICDAIKRAVKNG